ncbi:MAG TPA: hypothetical protein VKD22_11135, partial [Ramlibacter sp.]|nr:hypothetical protein [Ramlibacter sp.]
MALRMGWDSRVAWAALKDRKNPRPRGGLVQAQQANLCHSGARSDRRAWPAAPVLAASLVVIARRAAPAAVSVQTNGRS